MTEIRSKILKLPWPPAPSPIGQETYPQRAGGLGDQRAAIGRVMPVAGQQPHACAVPAKISDLPIILPQRYGGRCRGDPDRLAAKPGQRLAVRGIISDEC
jgi:hypothetical protein